MTTAIIILLILILTNGILVMAEIALVSARKTKLDIDAQQGDKLAELALENSLAPARFLSTMQIGITLIGILTGVYSDEIAEGAASLLAGSGWHPSYSHSLALAFVVFLATFVSIVIG